MTTATAQPKVTAKGRITLRRGLLDHIGARLGDRLQVVPLPNGHLDVAVEPKGGSWDAFFGSIKNDGSPPLTIQEMNEIVFRGQADDHPEVVSVLNNHPEAESTGEPIKGFSGAIKYHGPPVSIDEINETIAKGWAGLLDN